MNFKFTKDKTMTSIMSGVFLGILWWFVSPKMGESLNFAFIAIIYDLILPIIIIFALIYIVWSLFEKKSENKEEGKKA